MKKRCAVMYEEIISHENLLAAWEEFIRDKRKKKDVRDFSRHLSDEVVHLHEELAEGRYKHGPYSYFVLRDPKRRDIHKATVRDRLIHHAIHRKLYPFFARLFIADSYSCQTGKGVHRALDRFTHFGRKVSRNGTVTCWVLKCDIRKFFASIRHDVLFALLSERIEDPRVVELLRRVLWSFMAFPGRGLPLGNVTSQLFANIFMNEFDHFVKQKARSKYYIRYADDFVFLSQDRAELERLLPVIDLFLRGVLDLTLHPNKIVLQTFASGVDFLGWVHFSHHRVPRSTTRRRIADRLRTHPTNETLQSYVGLLQHGNAYKLREALLNTELIATFPRFVAC